MKAQQCKTRAGFTLIELLIVIAIIAILALIAIPNFLEAQTRSKTARVHADLRTLKIGLESYFVDYNAYPPDKGYKEWLTYLVLTTPVAYLTSVPQETFYDAAFFHSKDPQVPLNPPIKSFAYAGSSWTPEFPKLNIGYIMVSAGPNMKMDLDDDANHATKLAQGPKGAPNLMYDPTNGTISYGDIFVTNKEFYN